MRGRIVFLSFHTCPLLQPGRGWAGGMNVYVDELSRVLAGHGFRVDVFTRRHHPTPPDTVTVTSGYVLHHVEAGPPRELAPARSVRFVSVFADAVRDALRYLPPVDVLHSHYWLSGWAGLKLKRELGLPHVHSSHTLGRVKARAERRRPPEHLVRLAAEHEVIGESDLLLASTRQEHDELVAGYGADPARIQVVPPGVDHDRFVTGVRDSARIRLGWPPGPTLLFVGRLQEAKGPDLAVEVIDRLRGRHPPPRLVLVGAPSGTDGCRYAQGLRARVARLELEAAVTFADPVPHRQLGDVYRSADLVLVPSRTETFGLVAAEAQACGVPVLAARAGGLATVVGEGSGGVLIEGWDPDLWASEAKSILDDPETGAELAARGPAWAERFSWETVADRLAEIYRGLG